MIVYNVIFENPFSKKWVFIFFIDFHVLFLIIWKNKEG